MFESGYEIIHELKASGGSSMTCNYLVLNYGEQDGETPLTFAAGKGHKNCVSVLVSLGADVNLVTKVRVG